MGAYDPLGHRQEQFLGAANLGPFPDAFKEAWQTMHIEARENSGLSPDSPQEELQAALGCLADPDPARARGRSAPCARPGNDEGAPPDLSQGEDGSIPGDAGASEGNGAAQEGDSSEPVVTPTLALGGPGQKQSKSASGGARRQGSRRRAPEGLVSGRSVQLQHNLGDTHGLEQATTGAV